MTIFFMKKPMSFQLKNDMPLSTPIEELVFTVFDTETTGFQVATTDRLIELAAVQIQGLKVCEKETFQTYINPNRHISQEITELTGITNEIVETAPPAQSAIESFFDFTLTKSSTCFVGHCVAFDMLVLKHELKREKLHLKKQPTVDTLDLIGYIAPSFDMRDLHKYAKAFGTRIYDRHTALGDALTTAYLFVELLQQFKDRNNHTWGELLRATESQNRSLLF